MSKAKDRFFITLIALMFLGTAAINKASAATVKEVQHFSQSGRASWYGNGFQGRKTSSGERFNMHALTAAHRSLPLPSYVRVTNTDNGKSIIVRVNDRGPFHGNYVMDLSKGAAMQLGFVNKGSARIRIDSLDASNDNIQVATNSRSNQFEKVSVSLPKAAPTIALNKVSGSQISHQQAAVLTKTLFKTALTNSAFAPFAARESAVYLDSPVFGSLKEANQHLLRLSKQMQAAQMDYPIVLMESTKGQGYQVRIGPFKEQKHADDMKKRLSSLSVS